MVTIILQIVALLVAVVTTFASEFPCKYQGNQLMCNNRGLTAPPAGLWPNVTSLSLDENPITTFAKNAFTGFPSVTYFSAYSTLLTEIDLGDFVEMPELQTLILLNNYIKTVVPAPEGTTFANLESIDLNNNAITTLDPDFLFNAPKLYVLSIESNPIIVKEGQPIFNHNSVTSLLFGERSNFADIDIGALLAGVPNIKAISLTHARVNNITGAFVNNKRLIIALLDNNDITQITSNTFASEVVLETLSLVGNPLKRLDTAAVNKPMAELSSINITDTPLACNCGFEGLFWWADAREITISAKCGGEDLCTFTRRRSSAHKRDGSLRWTLDRTTTEHGLWSSESHMIFEEFMEND